MGLRNGLFVAVLAGALACALVASPALARRALRISPNGNFRGVLLEGQTLFIEFARNRIRCTAAIDGAINERVEKVRDTIGGSITRISITGCTSTPAAEVVITALGMPWNLTYQSFSGSLPNITGSQLNVANARFLSEANRAILCLFEGPMAVAVEAPGAVATEFSVQVTLPQNRMGGLVTPFFCDEGSALIIGVWELSPNLRLGLVD